jgi:Domain of Unknown Function (DUF930)
MRRWVLALAIGIASGTSLAAADSHIEAMLKRVDPSDRLEVICEYAAANRIGRDKNPYHPDRAVIDSLSPAKIKGDLAEGTGGAFRSGGQWYQFSFRCKTSPDRLKILSFDYRVGEKIPEDKWDAYGLWH